MNRSVLIFAIIALAAAFATVVIWDQPWISGFCTALGALALAAALQENPT